MRTPSQKLSSFERFPRLMEKPVKYEDHNTSKASSHSFISRHLRFASLEALCLLFELVVCTGTFFLAVRGEI